MFKCVISDYENRIFIIIIFVTQKAFIIIFILLYIIEAMICFDLSIIIINAIVKDFCKRFFLKKIEDVKLN